MTIVPVTLNGAELAVNGLAGGYAAVRNDGTDMIWFGGEAGIAPDKRGVVSLAAGQSAVCPIKEKTVYILGAGKATVATGDSPENPFKSSAQGGSGADTIARAAINEHTGNSDIHVTAAEKTAWSGKAELSDIPASLPADGGNADTVDGKHASDFVEKRGARFITLVPCNVEWCGSYFLVHSAEGSDGGLYIKNETAEQLHFRFEVKREEGTVCFAQCGSGTGIFPDMMRIGNGRDDYVNHQVSDTALTLDLYVPVGETGYIGFYNEEGASAVSVRSVYCMQDYSVITSAGFAHNADTLDGKHADDFASAAELSAVIERVTALEASV